MTDHTNAQVDDMGAPSTSRTIPLSSRLTRSAWESNLNDKKIPTEWMNALVMNYLTTQGHASAAATFERETGTPQILNPESTAVRMKIRNAIERDGNPAEAIDQVVDVNPEIVEERPELLFRLKKQEFIELVKQNRTDDALQFAEKELARRVEGEEGLLRELESAMALLMFEDPINSPLGHYLGDAYRQETADLLNASILASETRAGDGRSRLPSMLRLLLWLEARAEEVVKKEIDAAGGEPSSGLSFVPRIALGVTDVGNERDRGHAIDYANMVFGSAEGQGADGADMDISEEEQEQERD
jgi:hypothetical protein